MTIYNKRRLQSINENIEKLKISIYDIYMTDVSTEVENALNGIISDLQVINEQIEEIIEKS
ncbi:MAG: hypothetical protein ACYDEX_19145 [Mobilitalea sp.]